MISNKPIVHDGSLSASITGVYVINKSTHGETLALHYRDLYQALRAYKPATPNDIRCLQLVTSVTVTPLTLVFNTRLTKFMSTALM